MPRFTKDQLTAKGLRRREVCIPDTDGTVTIRELSTAEVREYADKFDTAKDESIQQLDILADLIVRGVIDEHGKPMFDNATEVKSMSMAVISHLAKEISKLSGMSMDSDEKKVDASN